VQSPEHEKRQIAEYMELEAPDEEVTHLEKVGSERVFATRYDIWDVPTDRGRWWVITPPTNLYSQNEFRSMDYALTFHIGLAARLRARKKLKAGSG